MQQSEKNSMDIRYYMSCQIQKEKGGYNKQICSQIDKEIGIPDGTLYIFLCGGKPKEDCFMAICSHFLKSIPGLENEEEKALKDVWKKIYKKM